MQNRHNGPNRSPLRESTKAVLRRKNAARGASRGRLKMSKLGRSKKKATLALYGR